MSPLGSEWIQSSHKRYVRRGEHFVPANLKAAGGQFFWDRGIGRILFHRVLGGEYTQMIWQYSVDTRFDNFISYGCFSFVTFRMTYLIQLF